MNRLEGRHLDAGMSAFPLESPTDGSGKSDQVRVPVHVDYVVEIPGTASFGERTELFPKQFGDGVAEDTLDRERVAVGMSDRTNHRALGQNLVGREVQFDLRQRRLATGPPVGHTTFDSRATSPVYPASK